MCRSIAEGGQRCAAHTRAAYIRAQRDVNEGRPGAEDRLARASIEYASTKEGRANFVTNAEVAAAEDDFEAAAEANSVVMWGDAMRAGNDEARRLIAADDRPKEFSVSLADGSVQTLHSGVFDQDAQRAFSTGQCFALAAAISEDTGWPMVVRESVGSAGEPTCVHVWVETPEGTFIDAQGESEFHPDSLFPIHDPQTGQKYAHRRVLSGQVGSAGRVYERSGLPEQNLDAARTFVRPVLDLFNNPTARHRTMPGRWAESA